jgi:hypothetical protein
MSPFCPDLFDCATCGETFPLSIHDGSCRRLKVIVGNHILMCIDILMIGSMSSNVRSLFIQHHVLVIVDNGTSVDTLKRIVMRNSAISNCLSL